MADIELPPLPTEFMPSSLFKESEVEKLGGMVTSTVRKPTDRVNL